MEEVATKTFAEHHTRRTQGEINQRQGIRLNIIKEQMKESLMQSNIIRQKLAGNDNGTEFKELVMGFSDKVQWMANDLCHLEVERERDSRLKAYLFA